MKCLVVVAHPDDEVIWAGGTIIRNSHWEWHVLSLCRRDDLDRATRFRKAARALNAQSHISDLDDSSPSLASLSSDLHEIRYRIAALPVRGFDLVFTHGPKGEYTEHARHRQAHRVVCDMIKSGELSGEMICFAYEDGGGSYHPRPAADADVLVHLTPDEYAAKQHIARDIYGYQPGSFEFESAGPVEAFTGGSSVLVTGDALTGSEAM